jgi:hypothetical protein
VGASPFILRFGVEIDRSVKRKANKLADYGSARSSETS